MDRSQGDLQLSGLRLLWQFSNEHWPAFLSTRPCKVHKPIYAPQYNDSQRDVWLLGTHAGNIKWTNKIKEHTHKVGQNPKQRDESVLECIESVVFAKRDDGHHTRHHVQEKRSKVADERHNYQTLRDARSEIVAPNSEAVPEVVRKRLNRVVAESGRTTEVEKDGSDGNDDRMVARVQMAR